MEHTSTFKRFMQDLVSNLGNAAQDPRVSGGSCAAPGKQADFHVEITEGTSCNVLFCVRLGIAAAHLSTAAIQIMLTHNMPRPGVLSGILGVLSVHPEANELCLWRCEPLENMPLPYTTEMLKRLVLQASEVSRQLAECAL